MNQIAKSTEIERRTLLSTCAKCGTYLEYKLVEISLVMTSGNVELKRVGVTKCPKCHK